MDLQSDAEEDSVTHDANQWDTNNENPGDMTENDEEGEDDDEDTGEKGGIDGLGEVLILLQQRWPQWKAASPKARKKEWNSILAEVKKLPSHANLGNNEWVFKQNTYLKWMQGHGRKKGHRKEFKLGQKWTARSVIREVRRDEIMAFIREKYGLEDNGKMAIQHYQPGLSAFMEGVSEAELQRAEQTAQTWNAMGAPAEVQASFATRTAPQVMKQFAEEMWKKGGIRLVMLAGFKNEKGEVFSQVYDFNKRIADGPSFDQVQEFRGVLDRYYTKCFIPKEVSDNSEDHADHVKRRGRIKVDREDAVKMVTQEDGRIWMPDPGNANIYERQALVRGFLTAKYRKVCVKPKAAAPFKKLEQHKAELFAPDSLPPGFIFPGDPSHMKHQIADNLIDHIRQWIDGAGEVHKPDARTLPRAKRNSRGPSKKAQGKAKQADPDAEESEGEVIEWSDSDRGKTDEDSADSVAEEPTMSHKVVPRSKGKGKEPMKEKPSAKGHNEVDDLAEFTSGHSLPQKAGSPSLRKTALVTEHAWASRGQPLDFQNSMAEPQRSGTPAPDVRKQKAELQKQRRAVIERVNATDRRSDTFKTVRAPVDEVPAVYVSESSQELVSKKVEEPWDSRSAKPLKSALKSSKAVESIGVNNGSANQQQSKGIKRADSNLQATPSTSTETALPRQKLTNHLPTSAQHNQHDSQANNQPAAEVRAVPKRNAEKAKRAEIIKHTSAAKMQGIEREKGTGVIEAEAKADNMPRRSERSRRPPLRPDEEMSPVKQGLQKKCQGSMQERNTAKKPRSRR